MKWHEKRKEILMQFHIQKAVQSVDPEAKVAIDLQTRNVDVTSQQPASAFESALAKVGYPALSTTASTAG